jgi:hypothetical protein
MNYSLAVATAAPVPPAGTSSSAMVTVADAYRAGTTSSGRFSAAASGVGARDSEECSVCWGFGAGDDGDPCPRCHGTG